MDAQVNLSCELEDNLAFLQEMFGTSGDFYTKSLQFGPVKAAAVLFTGIASPEKLTVLALDLLRGHEGLPQTGIDFADWLLTQSHLAAEPTPIGAAF